MTGVVWTPASEVGGGGSLHEEIISAAPMASIRVKRGRHPGFMGRGRVIARELLAGLAAGFMGKVLNRENSLSAPVAKENRRTGESEEV